MFRHPAPPLRRLSALFAACLCLCLTLPAGTGLAAEKLDAAGVAALRQKAEQGDTNAQLRLARAYLEGEGVAKDDAEARKWLNRAVDQSVAMVRDLLTSLQKLDKMKRKLNQASEELRKKVEQGSPQEQRLVGAMLLLGKELPQDVQQGAYWLRKAAERGDVESQSMLGTLHAAGIGVAPDKAEAARWWRKAAEQGNATAQLNLAEAYEAGRGVAKDEQQALLWYRKAAERGDAKAGEALRRLEGRVGPAPEVPAGAMSVAGVPESCVLVLGKKAGRVASATGFFAGPGLVVTSRSAAAGADEILVSGPFMWSAAKAEVAALGEGEGQDWAALRLDPKAADLAGNLVFAAVVRPGERVTVWGFPKVAEGDAELFRTLAEDPGAVLDLAHGEGVVKAGSEASRLAHDAVLPPGHGVGGPLVNAQGDVAGLNLGEGKVLPGPELLRALREKGLRPKFRD